MIIHENYFEITLFVVATPTIVPWQYLIDFTNDGSHMMKKYNYITMNKLLCLYGL
jgi:hypothetical protein